MSIDPTAHLAVSERTRLNPVSGLCVDMMVHEVFPGMRQGVASVRALSPAPISH